MPYSKKRNDETFSFEFEGKYYFLDAWQQETYSGVRECVEYCGPETQYRRKIIGKEIWSNRPWQAFRYEKALRRAIAFLAGKNEKMELAARMQLGISD